MAPPCVASGCGGASALHDFGPVSFHSGGQGEAQRELKDAFASLSAAGATLVSMEPPMWVLDGSQEVEAFLRLAEGEVAKRPGEAWDELDNPGAYALQERLGIQRADEGGLRRDLLPLSSLVQALTGEQDGFLEATTGWGGTVPVKRYRPGPGDALPEAARLGGEQVLALERAHIDRNRSREDLQGFRDPMRLTLIVSFDEAGGTYFPFAELLNECPGVEAVPTSLDERSTCAATEGGWPVKDMSGRGVLVRGRRGRLLVFASSLGAGGAPLYASLHQGVLLRAEGEDPGSFAPARMVSVIGACGNGRYETSAVHECLSNETIETRAAIFGRAVEEEAVGMMHTEGNGRQEEAREFLQGRAEMRRTTIEAIIAEELARNPELNSISGASSSGLPEPDVATLPEKIYWRSACSVCLEDLHTPDQPMNPEHVVPGFLSCGHVLCKTCNDQIGTRISRSGRAICPECRLVSKTKWRPLLVDGEWIADGDGYVEPELLKASKSKTSKEQLRDIESRLEKAKAQLSKRKAEAEELRGKKGGLESQLQSAEHAVETAQKQVQELEEQRTAVLGTFPTMDPPRRSGSQGLSSSLARMGSRLMQRARPSNRS